MTIENKEVQNVFVNEVSVMLILEHVLERFSGQCNVLVL